MIVADSSALCAVFFNEPEKSGFQAILDGDERCIVSAVNAFETACVLRGKLGSSRAPSTHTAGSRGRLSGT
jgi:uncharacterized protein with PIN domain